MRKYEVSITDEWDANSRVEVTYDDERVLVQRYVAHAVLSNVIGRAIVDFNDKLEDE